MRRIRWSIAAVVVLVLASGEVARAETLGYPWANAICVSTKQVKGKCANYDWAPSGRLADVYRKPLLYAYRNCTDYVAWKLTNRAVPRDKLEGLHHGGQWAQYAKPKGIRVDSKPAVGAAAVRTGDPGHVAYVEAVLANGRITVSDYNNLGTGEGSRRSGTPRELKFDQFVHFERYAYMNQIVRQSDGTSWLVKADGKRHWIPTGGDYLCLVAKGAKVFNLSAAAIKLIPDAGRDWARCK